MPALTVKKIAGWLAAIALAAAFAGAPEAGTAMGGGRGGSNDIGFESAGPRGQAGDQARGSQSRARDEGARALDMHGAGHGARPRRLTRSGGPSDDQRLAPEGDPFHVENGFEGDIGHGGFGRGHERFLDPAQADHRWAIGPLFDAARTDIPVAFPFAPHLYGDHDSQYCMRRDVYGDLYQAC